MKNAKTAVRQRRKGTPRRLTLSARVGRLERAVLFPPERMPPKQATRFTNLGADGKPTTGDHVAVQDARGLIWTAAPMQAGKEFTHADAIKAAGELDLLGRKDWRLPTIQELLSIIDYDRWNPAVDPKHFKGPYAWTWSGTLVKGEGSPAGYARSVFLGYGFSGWGRQGYHVQALAVRASQQLGLLE